MTRIISLSLPHPPIGRIVPGHWTTYLIWTASDKRITSHRNMSLICSSWSRKSQPLQDLFIPDSQCCNSISWDKIFSLQSLMRGCVIKFRLYQSTITTTFTCSFYFAHPPSLTACPTAEVGISFEWFPFTPSTNNNYHPHHESPVVVIVVKVNLATPYMVRYFLLSSLPSRPLNQVQYKMDYSDVNK